MQPDERDDDHTRSFTPITPGARFSRYVIESQIGAGGMGEVFLATDTSLDRAVVLKFIPPQYASDELSKGRFLREARAAAALNHPNIITIHEVGEVNGRVFIAMEHIDGQTLGKLQSERKLTVGEVIEILVQVCEGLREAHKTGIVHRDIKPSNIMLDANGRVRLLDFGLAKLLDDADLTQAGVAVGTINYMSPEQCRGGSVDHRSDLFSVGILLYEMLTNRQPFKRSTMPATLNAILNEKHPPISTDSDPGKSGVIRIVNRALEKNPKNRYQTVQEMLAELKNIAAPASAPSIEPKPVSDASFVGSEYGTTSMAVLYLKNLGSSEDEFLCYGITEDLIVDLSRIGVLRIASMRSILRYKDSNADLRDIADELNVGVILDGSISKSESSIRVSAQLVDVATEMTLWADRWDEPHDRLPQIKQALAEGVTVALRAESDMTDRAMVGVPEAKSAKAYELYLRGKFTFVQKTGQTDVDIAKRLYEQALDEEPSLIAARAGIAEILIHEGELAEAESVLSGAIEEARDLNRPADLSSLLRLQAKHRVAKSVWDEAEKYASEASKISKEMNDPAGEAGALAILIDIASRRAQFDVALRHFRRILEISRALDDQKSVAEALKNMGTVNLRKGEYETARALYEEAMKIALDSRNTSLEADCIGNKGLTYYHTADYDSAIEFYEKALAIHTELRDHSREALWTNNIAMVYESRGDYRRAMEYYEMASAIHKQRGDRAKYALTQSNCASMNAILGELNEGMTVAHEALEIAEELQFQMVVTATKDTLGLLHFFNGEIERATSYYRSAIDIAKSANLPLNLAFAHVNMAEILFYSGEFSICREHVLKSLAVAKLIGHREAQLKASAYDAALMVRDGLVNPGISMLREILKDSLAQGDPRYILIAQRLLGMSLMEFGRTASNREDGASVLREALYSAIEKQIAIEIKWIREIIG